MNSIAQVQEDKKYEFQRQYKHAESLKNDELERTKLAAAQTLQKNYRGYRARRELKGLSLDPSSRWIEAVKEAQYRELTTPHPRSSRPNDLTRTKSEARVNWSRVGKIARRAGGSEDSSLSSYSDSNNDKSNPSQKEARRRKKLAEKQERSRSAKLMDVSYFLEMVDVKHRYGSNLRKYHAEWKSRPTNENFFYWLDYGEGKDVEVEKCSRERLEKMQVRYLGREERRLYEVIVDKDGKLCWRKDGVRVDTTDQWRDSVRGIVRIGDPAPEWAHNRPAMLQGSSEGSGMSSEEENVTSPIATPPASPTKGFREPESIASVIDGPETPRPSTNRMSFSDLFRRPAETSIEKKKERKKKQIWIFVADTKNNLYIGIKQPGAFQHSSFLHGAKVSAAGLITIKNGQLRIIQPRSGHYKTPSHNLHIFIKSLQTRGVDMSMTAVGSTYAAMVGIETFMKSRGKIRKLKEDFRNLSFGKEKV
ncbi:hypothetical protein P7C71_g4521, partial [Lecanoromycetidae sp. Uapishka_2]